MGRVRPGAGRARLYPPLIVSMRLANGTVSSGCAAFVIKSDGWMVVAR